MPNHELESFWAVETAPGQTNGWHCQSGTQQFLALSEQEQTIQLDVDYRMH